MPYSTMHMWMTDDAVEMAKRGKRGLAGTPHYRVERDVRRRTSLPAAGGVKGGGTVIDCERRRDRLRLRRVR
jgi:hypothetical protein